MVNWTEDPRTLNDAINAAQQREHGPDGAGLGLACGCTILAAVACLVTIGIILRAVLS